jgi:hypothetical protein
MKQIRGKIHTARVKSTPPPPSAPPQNTPTISTPLSDAMNLNDLQNLRFVCVQLSFGLCVIELSNVKLKLVY